MGEMISKGRKTKSKLEPAHEIMVLFVLRKLILQTRIRSHAVGLDVWRLVGPFVYFHLYVCEQRRLWRDCADAQARLSLRWSPMWYVISTIISRAGSINELSPVKRICVFEHSVMTNFNCACPAIQRGQGSGFLSEGSSWFTACMSEQRRLWRDCADAQARLNLRCSHRR